VGARDWTKSGDPVTNFRRSNRFYDLNKSLDRDKDRIACEKR
jgi:Excalibur calcium-binding domain